MERLTILQGDALAQLKTLPSEIVQCCVTSPPYWGLRDYGTATWEGGVNGCDHAVRENPRIESSTLGGGKESTGHQREGFKHECPRCGAKRIDAQLGLEKTPEEYVARMVEIFREVCRVLRKDGTLWLNLGDSYASASACDRRSIVGNGSPDETCKRPNRLSGTLKEKDLCGIPWRIAFALQADGWWLRQDIIWNKPNPMPESVTDRCTKSHEYIFLLTKSARYFYDSEAIMERVADSVLRDKRLYDPEYSTGRPERGFPGQASSGSGLLKRSGNKSRKDATERGCPESGVDGSIPWEGFNRNKRSVWTVTTKPYPDAHFATYPPDLIKPCVLAGSQPSEMILDPFAGSGTTGMVALELGRKATLIELNPSYVELIKTRCDITPGLALAV